MTRNARSAAGLLCLAIAPAALACGYHGDLGSYLSVVHPDSVVVAVAMRRAADRGDIGLEDLDAPVPKQALLFDAALKLHALKAALASSAADGDPPVAFSIVFVESGLWSRFRVSDGRAQLTVHADGARNGEPTVLTGKSVLAKLVAGGISLDRALADRLVLIDGAESGRAAVRRSLASALSRAGTDEPGQRPAGLQPRAAIVASPR
jgi:hypothetical protein